MSILVTGATGFIGRHVVNALIADGQKVLQLAADITSEREMENFANGETIKREGPITAAIHMAAVTSSLKAQQSPADAWLTNVFGTHNVISVLNKIGCKHVVFFSSCHVYGVPALFFPTSETHPLVPQDTYTATKIAAENICRTAHEGHNIFDGKRRSLEEVLMRPDIFSYINLRLSNVYGPGQSRDYFVAAKVAQAKKEKLLSIRNGRTTKDFIHVKDVAQAAVMATKIQQFHTGAFNVSTGIETSLAQVVEYISEMTGIGTVGESVPDETPTRMCCSSQRLQALGWKPTISIDEGLRDLLVSH